MTARSQGSGAKRSHQNERFGRRQRTAARTTRGRTPEWGGTLRCGIRDSECRGEWPSEQIPQERRRRMEPPPAKRRGQRSRTGSAEMRTLPSGKRNRNRPREEIRRRGSAKCGSLAGGRRMGKDGRSAIGGRVLKKRGTESHRR
jgi:hypothetical protein